MFRNKESFVSKISIAALFTFYALSAHAVILTSIKPLGFIASAIADGVTPVQVLLPNNVSSHDYTLRPTDLKSIKDANLILWVGPQMETFLVKPLSKISEDKNLIIANIPGVKDLLVDADDLSVQKTNNDKDKSQNSNKKHKNWFLLNIFHSHKQLNMHVWMSEDIAKKCAIEIYQRLLKLMPEQKKVLDRNLKEFESNLDKTNKYINSQLSPLRDKGYYVFHNAYRYFEKQYGMLPLGYFTIDPKVSIGAQRLRQIKRQVIEKKAMCVFSEPQFGNGVISAVSQEAKIHQGTLDPLGTNIPLGKDSYMKFLMQLANQYESCLSE